MHWSCKTGRSHSACWSSARTNKKAHSLPYSQAGSRTTGKPEGCRERPVPATHPSCMHRACKRRRDLGKWSLNFAAGPAVYGIRRSCTFLFSATYFLLFYVCLPMALPLSLECSVRFWELLLMPPPPPFIFSSKPMVISPTSPHPATLPTSPCFLLSVNLIFLLPYSASLLTLTVFSSFRLCKQFLIYFFLVTAPLPHSSPTLPTSLPIALHGCSRALSL